MYIDIFLGVFVLLGVVQGYHRGIVRTAFAIAAIVIGLLASLKFSPYVVSLFDEIFNWDPLVSLVLGLAFTFVLIMWGIKWLGRSFEKTLKLAKINFINKLLGAVAFAVLMVVMYSGILWFADQTELVSNKQKSESQTYEYISPIPDYLLSAFESVKPVFKEFWDKLEDVIDAE